MRTNPINVPLLVDTLAQIEANPLTWNQGSWRETPYDEEEKPYLLTEQRCGAKLCFAGHVAALAGGKWLLDRSALKKMLADDEDPNDWPSVLAALKAEPEDAEDERSVIELPYGKTKVGVSARYRARRLLGLTGAEANLLFNGNNDIWELRKLVAKLILKATAEAGQD